MTWRQVKMTFIPKLGKSDYTGAKAYRRTCLSSFLLKTMEKLMVRHIGDSVLKKHPLHQNQHAYQIGKSTETVLHNVVTRIERLTKFKKISLGAFLDIVGVFYGTSFDVITQAVNKVMKFQVPYNAVDFLTG